MDYLDRLLVAFGPMPLEERPVAAANGLMEPLTRKELQILQLAGEGCSNAALSEKLGLSDSTVRTHLRNINTKLSAKSRADAVAIARRLGVVR
jgi:LuxR family maltose regulon positive regulatory protein